MAFSPTEHFQLTLLVCHDDSGNSNQHAATATDGAGTNNNMIEIWWPSWVFENYQQLTLAWDQYNLTGNHFQEYLAASQSDPDIFERRVAYLIGDHVPCSHRTIYNPQTCPLDNSEVVKQAAQHPGWLRACAQGSRLSNAAVAIRPVANENPSETSTCGRPPAATKAPGTGFAPRLVHRHKSSMAKKAKTKKEVKFKMESNTKKETDCGSSYKPAGKDDRMDRRQPVKLKAEEYEWHVQHANKCLTPRQKKIKSLKPESNEEREFYVWHNLWVILAWEGWSWDLARGAKLDTWYYLMPGRSIKNAILGSDYFNTVDSVIQHCKDNGYYAKYGTVMLNQLKSKPTPPRRYNRRAPTTPKNEAGMEAPKNETGQDKTPHREEHCHQHEDIGTELLRHLLLVSQSPVKSNRAHDKVKSFSSISWNATKEEDDDKDDPPVYT